MKTSGSSVSRRSFLKSSAVLAAPLVIPGSVLGLNGQTAPSNKITMAGAGWGMQGPGNMGNFMNEDDCQVVAFCDVDKEHLKQATDAINGRYGNQDAKGYHDYREMMARTDIDAVMLALPDHWHGLVSVEAANTKKDIFGEKPLARTIREQQAIVKAVQKNGRIWQTGSWQRSVDDFRLAAQIVRSGMIGTLKEVHVGLPAGHSDFAGTGSKTQVTAPPAQLDYEMWIGPAQMEDYIEGRVHKNWRWNYNIGGGQLLDWIGHHCDIAHWGMDMDNGGPSEIKPVQVDFPESTAVWNTATKYRTELTYPGGVKMTIAGGHDDIRGGTKWIGTDGWVWVDRGGFEASNPEWNDPKKRRAIEYKSPLYTTPGHFRNFLDCVKSRKPTVTPVETAHHSAIPGHLSLIALKVNRTLMWDAAREEIIGDEDASKHLGREYRGPWKLA